MSDKKKNIAVFMGHPAHFYMLRHTAQQLKKKGYNVFFVIKKKDILQSLLDKAGYSYTLIRGDRGNNLLDLIRSVLIMEFRLCVFLFTNKIDILVGSTLSFASRMIMRTPTITISEDE